MFLCFGVGIYFGLNVMKIMWCIGCEDVLEMMGLYLDFWYSCDWCMVDVLL